MAIVLRPIKIHYLHISGIAFIFLWALGLMLTMKSLWSNAASTSPTSPSHSHDIVVSNPVDINSIRAMNIFGQVPAPQVVDAATLPVTQLNLKLVGVMESTLTQTSRALIMETGKSAKTYFLGDELPGHITLNQIQKDFVIIERDAHLEKLELHPGSIESSAPTRRFGTLPAVAVTEQLIPTPSHAEPVATIVPIQSVYKEMESRLTAMRHVEQ